MSQSRTSQGLHRLSENVHEGISHVASEFDDKTDGSPNGTARELLEVLESTDALLEAIDLDRLPDVVDADSLPSLVDIEHLSEAIAERDPDLVFDLEDLSAVVDERELWNAVDLLEFERAKQRFDRELEDVVGEGVLDEVDDAAGGDSEAAADVAEYASSLREDAKDALVEQQATASAEVARDAVVDGHAALERLYQDNRTRFSETERRRTSRNPTAVSTLPSGPLPDSASTRVSTVPREVPYSKTEALPRIYGRRWRKTGSEGEQ